RGARLQAVDELPRLLVGVPALGLRQGLDMEALREPGCLAEVRPPRRLAHRPHRGDADGERQRLVGVQRGGAGLRRHAERADRAAEARRAVLQRRVVCSGEGTTEAQREWGNNCETEADRPGALGHGAPVPLVPKLRFGNAGLRNSVSRGATPLRNGVSGKAFPNWSLGTIATMATKTKTRPRHVGAGRSCGPR